MIALLKSLKKQKHNINSKLWQINEAENGNPKYMLMHKNVEKRRLRAIELRYELKKVLENIDEIKHGTMVV